VGEVRYFLLALIALVLAGCATGHCRARKNTQIASVFVYKTDGSKQCGMGETISLEAMAEELKGIKIISQSKKSDGKMYAMVCGGPTGKINVYEILATDLAKASSAGFKEYKSDN
jgi:hypothetical protein